MSTFPVEGTVTAGYEPVAQVFTELLAELPQGSALAVYRDHAPLLEIWGGARDKSGECPWQVDTRVNIFSAGKPAVAVAVLQLAAQGRLSLTQPIAEFWPEFACNGKQEITLAQVLCHRSGLSAFHGRVADATIFDPAKVRALLEQESPWWQPGSAQGYSPILYGWILAEVVCRVTGAANFQEAFRQTIADPLGLSMCFGVPVEEQASLADVGAIRGAKAEPGVVQLGRAMKDDPQGVVNKAFTNPMSLMVGTNSNAWRSAEIPAANGHASARDLARFYDALINDEVLLPESYRSVCWQECSRGDDHILQTSMRFSSGFMLTQPGGDRQLGRGERAFGHAGAGGCLGFADPDYQISFAFVSNQMAQSLLVDRRAERLINALYQVL